MLCYGVRLIVYEQSVRKLNNSKSPVPVSIRLIEDTKEFWRDFGIGANKFRESQQVNI